MTGLQVVGNLKEISEQNENGELKTINNWP